jgi:ribonuclease HII
MFTIGVDEAGRGPLAGPLAVGVVRTSEDFDLLAAFPGLNDSKQLTEKKRESIFALLDASTDIAYRVEWVTAAQIDEEGLTVSIREAIARGVRALMKEREGKVFLDGLLSAPPEYEQETVTGGDGIIPAIMLASVAAKVLRDRKMQELGALYPGYGFEKHKGYGTKAHYEAIKTLGPCAEHRRLFLRNLSV